MLLGFVFRRIMKIVFEPAVDKPGGGFAGFVSGILAVLIVFMIMIQWPNDYLNRKFGEESVIGRVVVKLAARSAPWMPAGRDKVDSLPVSKEVKKEIRKAGEL